MIIVMSGIMNQTQHLVLVDFVMKETYQMVVTMVEVGILVFGMLYLIVDKVSLDVIPVIKNNIVVDLPLTHVM
mgnify:CR=1 FL=1